ncbi:MAG: T9SS type A sorting domain-containing protein [Bacteroidota bacterium]
MKNKTSSIKSILICNMKLFLLLSLLLPTISFAQKVAAGYYHSIAVCSDGRVWSWGNNYNGQLGNGTTNTTGCYCESTPVQVIGPGGTGFLTGITVISAGLNHSLAVKNDGTVWSWGANGSGQLGNGTTNTTGCYCESTPVQVIGPGGIGFLTDITAIAGGIYSHSLAVKSDGTVWTWGANGSGQLGNGTTTSKSTPVQVLGLGGVGFLAGITAVASGEDHSHALKNDGTVWSWGSYPLGDGTGNGSLFPVQVIGPGGIDFLTGITAIAGGEHYHFRTLRNDGTVWTWGSNDNGELGNGTNNGSLFPVQVIDPGGIDFLTGITTIETGGHNQTLAVKNNGTVWSWGSNSNGQLGDGTSNNSSTPVQVIGPVGTNFLTGITSVAGGIWFSFAIKNDGTVWSWGDNSNGQLGDGTYPTDRYTPVQVIGLSTCNVTIIPIELLSFEGKCNLAKTQRIVSLQWSTASEINNNYFTIERAITPSPNGEGWGEEDGWSEVGKVKGAGNSSTTRNYEFIDQLSTFDFQLSTFFYYRLKQTDYDGQYKYSNPISVRCDDVEDIFIFPTVSSGQFQISGSMSHTFNLKVYNVLGKNIYEAPKVNGNHFQIDLSFQSNGIYFIHLQTKEKTIIKKIILFKL